MHGEACCIPIRSEESLKGLCHAIWWGRILAISVFLLSLGCCLFVNLGALRGQEPQPQNRPAAGLIGGAGQKAGEVRTFNAELNLKMVWCPAGTFQMGSPASDPEATDDEKPQHPVKLTSGFWLGQTEVTQGQWKAVMGTEPWAGKPAVKPGADSPTTYVSWNDAQEFCKKLTKQERAAGRLNSDQEYRLPTEAQWEYACRAGTKTTYSFGDDASQLSGYGWWGGTLNDPNTKDERYPQHPQRVATKKPNPWGLYDLHGNVWEWCEDAYQSEYYRSSPESDPQGPTPSSLRVFRGGSWFNPAGSCRSANRGQDAPTHGDDNVGFRIAAVSVAH